MMRIVISAWLLFSGILAHSQSISGVVYDELSRERLTGAAVQVLATEKGAISDTTGHFFIENLPTGRYSLLVTYVGYEPLQLGEVWVKLGKPTSVEVALKRAYFGLDEVVITTEKASLSEPGRLIITEEQINRFAATYYDPARLVLTSPDVAVANDQNNQISVRGISPAYNSWRLEGAEIVNPNHTSNAGTLSDQPAATGGGVNILSAQMLSRSSFHYGLFDNTLGNSVGGIFDMYLKEGNVPKRRHTAQASLIGIDLASDGPVREGGKVTYATNYRYSFTGILTNMGVDFGGESIGFQDLALSLSMPLGKKTRLKVFGIGGLSFNNFDHRDFEESETQKDRQDIYYTGRMGLVGATSRSSFARSKWVNTLVWSGYDNTRDENNYDQNDQFSFAENYADSYTIGSFRSVYTRAWGPVTVHSGTMVNLYRYKQANFYDYGTSIPTTNRIEHLQTLVQPFVQADHRFSEQFSAHYGLNYSYTANNKNKLDARLALRFAPDPRSTFTAGIGRYNQLYQPFNLLFDGAETDPSLVSERDFLSSYRTTLTYDYTGNGWNVTTELFHYRFPRIYSLFEISSAETTGLSVSSEKTFTGKFYYRVGGSVFHAPIVGWPRNRYNTKFNLSLATGKEWNLSKGDKNRSFSVNGRVLSQGGQHMINQSNWWWGWWWSDYYRTKNYFRTDLRIQWVRYREKYTRMIAIDIQNVLNTQNEAFQYFDTFTGQQEMQYQLGLIPILTYRVEW